MNFIDFTERLVPISDFSQGKAGKIFNDVAENNKQYIVLKNNQPTAVLISIEEYKEIQKKIERLEKFLEAVENMRLLKLAENRSNSKTISFEDLVNEEGFTMDEIDALAESIELE